MRSYPRGAEKSVRPPLTLYPKNSSMPLHGLIALLDDIATIADDVAKMTSLATQKAAGIVTDDMAVTAERLVGIRRDRELAIVRAVAIGSMRNKLLILVPVALMLNAAAPWAITPLLMIGALFLCFEGAGKVLHPDHGHATEPHTTGPQDFERLERDRVKGAIKTDFVLSAEIIAVSLATVHHHPFLTVLLSLIGISIIMTVGVYGLVAVLIRMDDMGLALMSRPTPLLQKWGRFIVWLDPRLIRTIAVIGTIAMLMVGGGIFVHGIPAIEHIFHLLEHTITRAVQVDVVLPWLIRSILTLALGFTVGVATIFARKFLGK